MILILSDIPSSELWEPKLEINLNADSHVFIISGLSPRILQIISCKTSLVSKFPISKLLSFSSIPPCSLSFYYSSGLIDFFLKNIYPSILQPLL